MGWRLDQWNQHFTDDSKLPPMTLAEIKKAVFYFRDKNYPKPEDCPEANCSVFRPACKLGICKIAVEMCGDF